MTVYQVTQKLKKNPEWLILMIIVVLAPTIALSGLFMHNVWIFLAGIGILWTTTVLQFFAKSKGTQK